MASIAGSLPSSFWEVAKNLQEFITYLAISLPPQSTFFIQYMLVSTIIGLLFEMLRITQIWQDQIRKRVWWNLTDKEANKKFKFLRPLGDPRNFFHARVFAADTMLLYMIGFVYTPLAPITCYFLAFCFFVQEIAFRHQFIYIYPTTPDSGGRLWLSSVQVLIVCMLSGEITLCVYLILKQAPVAAPMMVPLIITTILFAVYIHQRHFRVARSLSMEDCLHYDQINTEEGMNFDFVEGKYRNPALAHRTILPDNLPSRQIPDVSEAASRESKSEKAEIMGDALDASARSDELVG